MGAICVFEQFRNRMFVEYPFNLDNANNYGLMQEGDTSTVHKKQPPFFMYVKEESDML